jgi:hypothetical protein
LVAGRDYRGEPGRRANPVSTRSSRRYYADRLSLLHSARLML